MANIEDLEARKSEESERARAMLVKRIKLRETQQNLVLTKVMSTVLVDKLVDPRAMEFEWHDGKLGVCFRAKYDSTKVHELGPINYIHSHALGQMVDTSGLTRIYEKRLHETLDDWRHDLLVYNFNELFHKTRFVDRKGARKRFLVRSVDGEIRGFHSQNFNRKLRTAPLLRAFIEQSRHHYAGPVETTATDVRVRVKYMLPYVFEPVGGEFVSFGAAFGNSDFGAGRLVVSGVIQRINSGTTAVLDDKYSRTHIGSMIRDSDLVASAETEDKELEAAIGYVRDAVDALMGVEGVERGLKAIQLAHENEVPWYRLKNRLADLLAKEDLDMLDHIVHGGAAVVDLPPVDLASSKDGDSPTAWWAANAVSMFADKAEDPDKKSALQTMAGQLMTG